MCVLEYSNTCKQNTVPLLYIYTSMILEASVLASNIYHLYHYGLQSPPAPHPYLEAKSFEISLRSEMCIIMFQKSGN